MANNYGNAYSNWVATTQSSSNEWQYFYLANDRKTATLLSNYQTGNEVIPNEVQWDNNEDGGNYPFVQKVANPNTNVPSGVMRDAFGGTPNLVIHPSNTNDRLAAIGWKNTSGSTKNVSGTITLKLANNTGTSDGIKYYFHRNLVDATRYNLHSSGDINQNDSGTVTITFTDYEVQNNELLYISIENDASYVYDHTITTFNIGLRVNYTSDVMTVSTSTLPMPTVTATTLINLTYNSDAITSSALIVMPAVSATTIIDLTYSSGPLTSSAEFPAATWSAETVINASYTSGVLGTASAEIVDPTISINVNVDAFGVATASSDTVMPSVSLESNINYSHTVSTASSLMTEATITATKTVNVSASPLTASALLSANNYYGPTIQDTSYTLLLRQIGLTNNIEAKNGFSIGSQYTGSTLDSKTSLLLRSVSDVPAVGSIIKAKFDPAHVTTSAGVDYGVYNTFNIYVFTEAPASWTTFTYANLPAKELISTSRLVDDGSPNQFHLDITKAAQDSRAYTYGIFIEHVGTPPYSGTEYDRTEFSGSSLDTKLMYILTSEFVNKNVNADPMTASAEYTAASVSVERYINVSIDPSTASSDIVNPSVVVENSNEYTSGTLTASGLFVNPSVSMSAVYISDHLEAFADMLGFTLNITGVVNYSAAPATASALFHVPQFDIGENNSSDTMNASATFPMPLLVIPETTAANVMNASTEMAEASTSGQLLGIVSAAPMIAIRADIVTPPQFVNLFADKWYSRLWSQHGIKNGERFRTTNLPGDTGASSASAFMKLFNDISVDKVWGGVGAAAPTLENYLPYSVVKDEGNSTDATKFYATMSQPLFTNVQPKLGAGGFDPFGRKTAKFQNVMFNWQENINTADRGYSLEFSIKTTKSNQIIASGQWNSFLYSGSTVSGIGLRNGKLYGGVWTNSASTPFPGFPNEGNTLFGRARIDDGNWHHIVIQCGYDGRAQFWVDGQLDIQSIGSGYGPFVRPYRFGWNSNNVNLYSDFETSVWSYDAAMFVEYRDLLLNAYAYIDYDTIKVEPFYADITATQDNKARGNRGRALMLYWWPTTASRNDYTGVGYTGVPWQFPRGAHTWDQGVGGLWDFDSSIPFSTWDYKGDSPQTWYDWDIFPVDVQGKYVSEVVKPESYGGSKYIRNITYTYDLSGNQIGDFPVGQESLKGFVDPITDAPRYIDVLNDVDLSQFDMIFFRNFPNQSREQDEFTKGQVYDSYFGGQERELYEKFLKGLRAAVDTGISLYINDYQLAIDFGIIDRVDPVPLLKTEMSEVQSDPHAPTVVPTNAQELEVVAGTRYGWDDTFYNNRIRIVKTFEGITDTPKMAIKKDTAHWRTDGLRDFNGNDFNFEAVQDRPNGLLVGDEFLLISPSSLKAGSLWQGVPLSAVKAGTAIATFGAKYWDGNIEKVNPYKDHATFIAVKPGDNVNGRQIGGKVIVSLTHHIADDSSYSEIDLNTDYWINIAYENGVMSAAKRDELLASPRNLNRAVESGGMTQAQFERDSYWTRNEAAYTKTGYRTIERNWFPGDQFQGEAPQNQKAPLTSLALQNLLSSFMNVAGWGQNSLWFMPVSSYDMDTFAVWTPTINHLGIQWLSDRTFIDGLKVPQEGSASSTSDMLMPTITVQKQAAVNVQAFLASAKITETQIKGPDILNTSLPFEAYGLMTSHVKIVNADPMVSTASMRPNNEIFTTSIDEIVLYVYSIDPIVYLREDTVK